MANKGNILVAYRSAADGDSWRTFWRELGEVSSVLWVLES